MTDEVQKIRKEVERLINELIQERGKYYSSDVDDACILELQNVLTYIDSLQEEPVSEDLEEVASSFARKDSEGISNPSNFYYTVADKMRIFKAGAQWQKEKDVKKIKTAIDFSFHGGRYQKEEEMLKNAIDATCFGFQGDALFSFKLPADKYLVGSKVKVIVINED